MAKIKKSSLAAVIRDLDVDIDTLVAGVNNLNERLEAAELAVKELKVEVAVKFEPNLETIFEYADALADRIAKLENAPHVSEPPASTPQPGRP